MAKLLGAAQITVDPLRGWIPSNLGNRLPWWDKVYIDPLTMYPYPKTG